MDIVNVIVAALVAWAFGAAWYMIIGKQWMEASGLTEESIDPKNFAPHVVSLAGAIVVAWMMHFVLGWANVESVSVAILTGLGLGLFVVCPWMVNNIVYGQRDRRLIWMDGLYPVAGMAIISAVLVLF